MLFDLLPEERQRMQGLPGGAVGDLVPARKARGGDHTAFVLLYLGKQNPASDGHADIVVFISK